MFSWSPQIKASSTTSQHPGNNEKENATQGNKHSRDSHLKSYLGDSILKPSTRRVSKDDSTYDTVFQTKAGNALILRVHLPPPTAFSPSQSPGMTLVGVIAMHPWIDSRMRLVGYEPIKNDAAWAASGLRLGQAVNSVVQHLQLNPPEVIEITDPSLRQLQATISGQNGNAPTTAPTPTQAPAPAPAPASTSRRNETVSDPPPDYDAALFEDEVGLEAETSRMSIPAVPESFPELESMTTTEMRKLLNSRDEFISFVEQMSAVKTLNDLRESVSDGNAESAEANLEKEKELTDLHGEITNLRSELQTKVDDFRQLEARQTELVRPPERRDVIKQLTVAKKDAFKESEEIASDFVDGSSTMDVGEFVENFIEKRIVHHERAAKVERLSESI